MKLPERFPDGTEFANALGVPVTVTPDGACIAWDGVAPRRFHYASFLSGVPLDEVTFRKMVQTLRSKSGSGSTSS